MAAELEALRKAKEAEDARCVCVGGGGRSGARTLGRGGGGS